MNKELIDKAWACLPREFREEVKVAYMRLTSPKYLEDRFSRGMKAQLETLFCIHNLISDTEGEEEMLCVSRKRVQKMWQTFCEVEDRLGNVSQYSIAANDLYYTKGEMSVLDILFGSKCLPDEVANEVNFASKEPKFRKGDKFRYKKNPGEVYTVDRITNDGSVFYWDKDADGVSKACIVNPEYIEPYTAPKENVKMKPITSKVSIYLATKKEDEEFRMLLHENGFRWNGGDSLISLRMWKSDIESSKIHFIQPDKTVTYEGDRTSDTLTFSEFKKRYFGENVNHRQFIVNCDKGFDNILKDSFRNERRLNIAVQILSNIVASSKPYRHPIKRALELTDALIEESEKGGVK